MGSSSEDLVDLMSRAPGRYEVVEEVTEVMRASFMLKPCAVANLWGTWKKLKQRVHIQFIFIKAKAWAVKTWRETLNSVLRPRACQNLF